jgi:hypothetical protein
VDLHGFKWWDLAAMVRYGGKSIPGFEPGSGTPTSEAQLRDLISRQPLAELEALQDREDFQQLLAQMKPVPPDVVQRKMFLESRRDVVVEELLALPPFGAHLTRAVSKDDLRGLVQQTFVAAAQADRQLKISDLLPPLGRSLTAALYPRLTAPTPTMAPPLLAWSDLEKFLLQALEKHLGGQRGFIGNLLKAGCLKVAARGLKDHRSAVMETLNLFVGDILVYLAHRDKILERLENDIAALGLPADAPLWLIGHSLGGIICFDYCVRYGRPIARLVTVGSQVGLFAEYGALLHPVRMDGTKTPLPTNLRAWHNVYDLNDFLSFLISPVFDGAMDHPFDTQAPFPASHSEYWFRKDLYPILVQ